MKTFLVLMALVCAACSADVSEDLGFTAQSLSAGDRALIGDSFSGVNNWHTSSTVGACTTGMPAENGLHFACVDDDPAAPAANTFSDVLYLNAGEHGFEMFTFGSPHPTPPVGCHVSYVIFSATAEAGSTVPVNVKLAFIDVANGIQYSQNRTITWGPTPGIITWVMVTNPRTGLAWTCDDATFANSNNWGLAMDHAAENFIAVGRVARAVSFN